jgi:diacylglycerol kinase (ATP)
MKPGLTGVARWMKAFQFSWQGFRAAYKFESAFREEVWLALVAIPVAFYFGETPIEVILLSGSVLMLIVVELLNSAIEATVDRIGEEHHELSGRAKDMGSSAVLVMLIIVSLTWILILLPKFMSS